VSRDRPAHESPADPDPSVLDTHRLREAFAAADYTVDAVEDLLGPRAFLALARGQVVPALRATRGGSPLETLVRLFLLRSTEPEAAVQRALSPSPLGGALSAGLVARAEGGLRAGLDVRPYADDSAADADGSSAGWWVVSDLADPRTGRLRPDHVLGIGGASVSLAKATVRPAVGSALDVGAGSGVQSLHLARHAGAVTATDTNRRALRLAALTAALSGVDVELRHGSLLEPVAGRRFDLVVSNPPFVIGPASRYSYRDAGFAGDEVGRRLVTGLPGVLAEGGWGQLLANWLHVEGRDWKERVGEWVEGTGCDAWVVQREVQDPAEYVELWLRDSGESDDRERYDEWLTALERDRVQGIGFGLVSLHASGADDPVVRLEDLRAEPSLPIGDDVLGWGRRVAVLRDADLEGLRLRVSEAVRLEQVAAPGEDGWEVVAQGLRLEGGLARRGPVDGLAAAVVAGCDGRLPLGGLLDVVAVAHGVDGAELRAGALPAVRRLVEEGFLLPPDPAGVL
jgi:methylase of polypeptide subunit release factors